MLLLSSGRSIWEHRVDLAGQVALDAADRFGLALALADSALEIGTGGWVGGQADDGDAPERRVQVPVAASVEAVPRGFAAAGWHGVDTAECGERALLREPAAVVAGTDQDAGRGLRSHAMSRGQVRCNRSGDASQPDLGP